MTFILKIAKFAQKGFYTFLDISGILLGIFLTTLGSWIVSGREVSHGVGAIILVVGIIAFLIHIGHYFSWKLTQWLFGKNYFLTRRSK